MSSIKDLPGAGPKFSARVGLGSFQHHLQRGIANSAGQLHLLKPHTAAVQALTDHVAKHQLYIRRGGLSEQQIRKIRSEVFKSDETLTKTSKDLVKKTLQHLSRAEAQKSAGGGTSAAVHAATVQRWRTDRRDKMATSNAVTSIYDRQKTATVYQTGTTAVVQRQGDVVKLAKAGGPRSGVVGSVAELASRPNAPSSPSRTNLNQNFRPVK